MHGHGGEDDGYGWAWWRGLAVVAPGGAGLEVEAARWHAWARGLLVLQGSDGAIYAGCWNVERELVECVVRLRSSGFCVHHEHE